MVVSHERTEVSSDRKGGHLKERGNGVTKGRGGFTMKEGVSIASTTFSLGKRVQPQIGVN